RAVRSGDGGSLLQYGDRVADGSCRQTELRRAEEVRAAMPRTKVVHAGLVALACVLIIPPAASAQQTSAIAGVVRDTSGAVPPGVTVEAASPALIERVRTVVTDD